MVNGDYLDFHYRDWFPGRSRGGNLSLVSLLSSVFPTSFPPRTGSDRTTYLPSLPPFPTYFDPSREGKGIGTVPRGSYHGRRTSPIPFYYQ